MQDEAIELPAISNTPLVPIDLLEPQLNTEITRPFHV